MVITNRSKKRLVGFIKKFNHNKNYGFIKINEFPDDVFFHKEDLLLGNIQTDVLKNATEKIWISFIITEYIGKNHKSKKATHIKFLNEGEEPKEELKENESQNMNIYSVNLKKKFKKFDFGEIKEEID